jgi:hypothetical protein
VLLWRGNEEALLAVSGSPRESVVRPESARQGMNLRKLARPVAFILRKIGKTGYWFNQTFIPMGNYVHYWIQGDEALARYKQPYDPRWYRQK